MDEDNRWFSLIWKGYLVGALLAIGITAQNILKQRQQRRETLYRGRWK